MSEVFRSWISTILGIGIIFTIIRIITPNTKLKSYIYSLMGIVTIIVILNPLVIIFRSDNIESNVKDIMVNMNADETFNFDYLNLSGYELASQNNLKEAFRNNIANDIKNKLGKNIDNEVEVSIDITQEYEIDNITINLKGDTSFDVTSFISIEYDVEKEKIQVIKGG
ncbi:MAG: stage III sporulation protein AF [Clostridia bacterium]|nr:stage III sporulation protein AF [Clostridia bacterium]